MNNIDINSSLLDKNIIGLKQKLDSIFSKTMKNSNYNGKDANYKLIAIIFLLSMGSSFSVDKNIGQISNLMNYFVLYNKIYINDINISFILFLSLIVFLHLMDLKINFNLQKKYSISLKDAIKIDEINLKIIFIFNK